MSLVSLQHPNICEQLEVGGGGEAANVERSSSRLREVWDYLLRLEHLHV